MIQQMRNLQPTAILEMLRDVAFVCNGSAITQQC